MPGGSEFIDNDTLNAGLAPDQPEVLAFVLYLERNGICFEAAERGYWHWVSGGAVLARLSLRTFPPSANQEAMRSALGRVNLAYRLNARAHLAMSAPPCQGNELQLKLLNLFEAYHPY